MQVNVRDRLLTCLHRAAMAIVAGGVVAAASAHANPSNNLVLVPPADLPVLARQTGESMFLYDRFDDRTLLYIEQNQGARLAIFDVTDPVHIKGEGAVQLNASGPFDFISPLRNEAELVRFRQGPDAVLDLHRMKDPQLRTVPAVTWQGPIPDAGDHAFPIDTDFSNEVNRMFDVKQVRAQLTKGDTGTTFVLTDNGLYVIRRPNIEFVHQMMIVPPN